MRGVLSTTLVMLCLAGASAAETGEVPPAMSPATVGVPQLGFTATRGDANHYWEYFYFHKSGVTYERAVADLQECFSYSRYLAATSPVPNFVPLGASVADVSNTGPYRPWTPQAQGVAPSIIYAIASNSVNHGLERSNTRRCLFYKGYKRYGLNEELWEQISKGTDAEIVARFAVVASGPAPQAMEIEP